MNFKIGVIKPFLIFFSFLTISSPAVQANNCGKGLISHEIRFRDGKIIGGKYNGKSPDSLQITRLHNQPSIVTYSLLKKEDKLLIKRGILIDEKKTLNSFISKFRSFKATSLPKISTVAINGSASFTGGAIGSSYWNFDINDTWMYDVTWFLAPVPKAKETNPPKGVSYFKKTLDFSYGDDYKKYSYSKRDGNFPYLASDEKIYNIIYEGSNLSSVRACVFLTKVGKDELFISEISKKISNIFFEDDAPKEYYRNEGKYYSVDITIDQSLWYKPDNGDTRRMEGAVIRMSFQPIKITKVDQVPGF